jgi:hypothetical protein
MRHREPQVLALGRRVHDHLVLPVLRDGPPLEAPPIRLVLGG